MNEEIYVAEYNFQQQAPHIQTIQERNQRSLQANKEWRVICIGTFEECNKALDELKITS